MIIPTMTINFVESIIIAKDKINKNKADEIYFTDDGFAIGLAYILKVLGQESNYESLNWFRSVNLKLLEEQEKLANAEANDETSKMQQISRRKISTYKQEFQLLDFAFNSARIFFSEYQ